jgi:TPP-dependent pyruvate/acetoin dehydrogenase alpha subunit
VDGNDVEAVHAVSAEIIEDVRKGKGPYLLECETYRIEGHYYGDAMIYRDKAEVEKWRKKDPILRAEKRLIERGILSEEACRAIEAEVRAEVEEAVAFAEASPEPALDAIFEDIFTEEKA